MFCQHQDHFSDRFSMRSCPERAYILAFFAPPPPLSIPRVCHRGAAYQWKFSYYQNAVFPFINPSGRFSGLTHVFVQIFKSRGFFSLCNKTRLNFQAVGARDIKVAAEKSAADDTCRLSCRSLNSPLWYIRLSIFYTFIYLFIVFSSAWSVITYRFHTVKTHI